MERPTFVDGAAGAIFVTPVGSYTHWGHDKLCRQRMRCRHPGYPV